MTAPARGSLVVVGTGIKLVAHATTETVAAMRGADRVLFLVNDPATANWIRGLNPSAESLADAYVPGIKRTRIYQEMTRRIERPVRAGMQVCAAFYGHPGVFVDAAHAAIRRLRRDGFEARMLPGISAEDCLITDLGFDPGDSGCQSFEATDFLLYRRRFDPTAALILWQVGVLGESSVRDNMTCRPERLRVLSAALRRSYPASHRVVLYEAAQFPVCEPVIERLPLARLARRSIRPMTTLYVPPLPSRRAVTRIQRWFTTS